MNLLEIRISGYKMLICIDMYGNQTTVSADPEAVEMLS